MVGHAYSAFRVVLVTVLAVGVTSAWGQSTRREPYSGYVYPAGGEQGRSLEATVGGQNLRDVTGVYVTGGGVQASVIEYVRPLNNQQLRDVGIHLRAHMQQRRAEMQGQGKGAGDKQKPTVAKKTELPELPDHPWLRGLEKLSSDELNRLRLRLFDPKKQPNTQIAEWVLVELEIANDAAPGLRELRVSTPQGLSNPVRFKVGLLAEVNEQEPNARQDAAGSKLKLPVVLNGQIMPGDTDTFRFEARKGQRLVLTTEARSLMPYLADAVPGWFQATLAIYDADGKEVAYADDYRFAPDPVVFYEVPRDGEYTVEIRDAIYRGREDFVYRITVGEQPFITQMFPLGGRTGATTSAAIAGLNLPTERVELATAPGAEYVRQARWRWDAGLSNVLAYAVDTLPECEESEPNDSIESAQEVRLPQIINGRIGRSGDVDVFRFESQAGDEIVAEVYARRLQSPLDSLLRLTDITGRVLAWNDDHEDKRAGLFTHHADSHLSAVLEKKGTYTVQIGDTQQHGGDEYCYRLRIGPRRPDFALRLTPSSIAIPAGRAVAMTVYALRQEGFGGAIEVALTGAPEGFILSGGYIPAGRDHVRMTLTAPKKPTEQPIELHLEGRAQVGEATVRRPVVAAEDLMQAFFYRHLVPSQKLAAMVLKGRPFAPTIEVLSELPLQIRRGGTTEVQLEATGKQVNNIHLELNEAPAGVSLHKVTEVAGGLALVLQSDVKAAEVGYEDNLIVDVAVDIDTKGRDGKARKWRVWLGALPAIPFEIVKQ